MTPVIESMVGAQPIVDTSQGRVRGTVEQGCFIFRGIPYAEPHIGRDA